MASVPSVATAFFPLDEELGLLPGHLTPTLHSWLVRLSAALPFAAAAAFLSEVTHTSLSEGSAQRLTYAAGTTLVAQQTHAANQIVTEMPAALPGPACLLLSADGAMVPLVGGAWAEVKTLVAGAVAHDPTPDGPPVVRTTQLSSFSRMAPAEAFIPWATVETYRRGVERAGQVVAISDGAEWIQALFDLQCPQAQRILDFPHAAQRLSAIAAAVLGEDTPAAQTWAATQCHTLKQQGLTPVLAAIDQLVATPAAADTVAAHRAYLAKRHALMDYPAYQAAGWPIGSGCVESANKLVVEARLKGAGMHWAREHVNPMVALRNVVCSDRWAEDWPTIAQTARVAARLARRERRHPPAGASAPTPEPTQRPPLPGGKAHAPPATHPWKRPALPGGVRHNHAQNAAKL